MPKSKLYRNLKPGDQIILRSEAPAQTITGFTTIHRHKLTIKSVEEIKQGYLSHRRQWQVNGNYPFWFPTPIRAYSNQRVELI